MSRHHVLLYGIPLLLVATTTLAHTGTTVEKLQPGCESLMTEAECRQHLDKLANLANSPELLVYMREHQALIQEREVMCGCDNQRRYLARAAYR